MDAFGVKPGPPAGGQEVSLVKGLLVRAEADFLLDPGKGIAMNCPGDVDIETHPAVIFPSNGISPERASSTLCQEEGNQ